ncbi:MAG: zinc metalloprotease HtpX [Candidatus Pacearchaeota archaeon]|nr:zinc metalloprotease HtpX [Candidatus Pacearchaeota archaeon]
MWNQIKTVLLLGILTGILLLIGDLFGKTGLTVAIVIVVLMNSITYFFSDKIALMMYRAKELKKSQYPLLHSMVKDIAKRAGIPGPKGIYLIPTPQANAFCAGRGPSHYVVACTEGILSLLTKEELKGVLAHEIGHAKNRDVLIATIAATIAGVITYLAHMLQFTAIFGRSDDNQGSGNIVSLLVLAILTPIIAMIIQLAISRSREYLADETGAKIVKDGKPLASALEKINASVKDNPMKFGSEAGSSLFIANPFKGNFLINMFSTHPPFEKRVERLREMRF